ncbi:MAG: precorrin-6Y C5,15-methyltransferase (decarboxylating) subunit CbiT, partial [Roseburia sp.]|nr:precorrin-6Y C5,15-methyltransferase (decarboxylating) subunit CbiT [Roseburia sp.]
VRRETESIQIGGRGKVTSVKNQQQCVEMLSGMEGNILLTTGSKELPLYCQKPELRERLFVRVLPGEESLRICREQGLTGKQIIAMQGPFSKELNVALLNQFHISCLVTKESGETGGYPEKLAAAAELQIPVIVIENPESRKQETSHSVLSAELEGSSETAEVSGLSLQETAAALEHITGKQIFLKKIKVVLAGIGMGAPGVFTEEVKREIKQADYLFGAKRILSSLPEQWNTKAKKQNLYLAEDIFSCLSEELKHTQQNRLSAVLLFSGDIGFFSGAKKAWETFAQWEKELEQAGIAVELSCCPGISSVSYLSAKSDISYQNAKILSLHGASGKTVGQAGEEYAAERQREEIEKAVRTAEKERTVFLITSGLSDIKALGHAIAERKNLNIRMTIGYQLSYPEEKIFTMEPENCGSLQEEGLYTCILENEAYQEPRLTHGYPDESFCRGKVPMTKEEVREVSLCKLRLTQNAVLYDIGSGTGSIAVEAGALSENIKVYAIERKEEALGLIRENCKKFGLGNVELVAGTAPEALEALPVPTHGFIGGSGGNLKEILALLYRKNPNMRVVITAVTLETVGELAEIGREFPITEEELVQISVSRAKAAGRYHLMQAENPVYLMSFRFAPERESEEEKV